MEAGQDPWRTPGDRSKQKGGVWDVVIHTGQWPLRFMECKRNSGKTSSRTISEPFWRRTVAARPVPADFAIVNWVQV